ncbi:1-acylglycerol-3-phosphate O-acyltransferase [Cohnella sp. CFH 77786]|uniref:lysophospholipid acyltransferase family protein n=1 Tax=Cohnella sp. CFH 77786 TaxID=2662265 RepID=UPI001C60F14C|nr:lysophospholipid acyltransferase family protein [Cohnella sp. CFH 77786]MBW5446664.1 1-acylglycerol-3-phosphate O-acyltransferase [Cohnella sp. CFH 77786]
MLYSFSRVIVRFIYRLFFRLEARGLDNIPEGGPVVLCSNHKSSQDPFTLGAYVPRKVHYMAKAELFRVPVVGQVIRAWGAFPVKRGAVSKEAIRTAIELLQQGHVMGIFPEGTRNSDGKAKRGAVTIAIRSGATVIPVALVGEYRLFRKMIAVYGAPVDLKPYAASGTSEAMEEATEVIMSKIREMLKTGIPSS